ncbi:hypothetical protein LV779_09615 [Streptomyces thinghirensis]|nr:hypothetical protein [Streptomyces thinghirensis]
MITVGGLMLTIGTGVALLAFRARPPSAWVLSVIVIGAVWVAASIASLTLDWWDTTTVGTAWIALQAAPVSLLSIFQLAALRARDRLPAHSWGPRDHSPPARQRAGHRRVLHQHLRGIR